MNPSHSPSPSQQSRAKKTLEQVRKDQQAHRESRRRVARRLAREPIDRDTVRRLIEAANLRVPVEQLCAELVLYRKDARAKTIRFVAFIATIVLAFAAVAMAIYGPTNAYLGVALALLGVASVLLRPAQRPKPVPRTVAALIDWIASQGPDAADMVAAYGDWDAFFQEVDGR